MSEYQVKQCDVPGCGMVARIAEHYPGWVVVVLPKGDPVVAKGKKYSVLATCDLCPAHAKGVRELLGAA